MSATTAICASARPARKPSPSTACTHINGIKSFSSFAKRRLAKFNGITGSFGLHLKESEWRRAKDLDTRFKELSLLV